jgi:hypothetical protein
MPPLAHKRAQKQCRIGRTASPQRRVVAAATERSRHVTTGVRPVRDGHPTDIPRPTASRPCRAVGESLVAADAIDLAIIAVLVSEGVGKTWLVAQWWSTLPDPPILILVAGRRAEHLIPGDALESFARLLAEQAGSMDEKALRGWRRRLQRWKGQGVAEHLRFVVVLDGISAQITRPRADVIKGLAKEAQALGGLVVVTSRNAFWSRDLFPRLRGSVAVRTIEVTGYDDRELAGVLETSKVAQVDLPLKVREFIRNPRICAIALNLLGRLALLPNELNGGSSPTRILAMASSRAGRPSCA